jgi:WD40 repeat protein/serine/threonine protein kinase
MPDGTTAQPVLREFGDYELIEEVGHGGMGVIFKARQRSLNRIVAVKLIRAGSLAKQADIARFRTEAAAAARLQHPHIVAIYEVGEHQGQQFYSMEFVPGHSLARELRQGPLVPREAARLLMAVAEAIHSAHHRGVLHRDLKPSNVLLDSERQPRVADFGLAKILQSDSELTLSGAVIGSPQYMPPEQARGKSSSASPRSDVYALGAILYESLTGRPPFSAPTPLATMKLVVEQEPIPPRALNPALPLDLDTICLKCLAKEPNARYASAQELADELDRFLRDEPIRARRVTARERSWRWCRRNPALASLGFVLAVAPVVIISILLFSGSRITRERNHSVAQLYASDVALAARALEAQDYGAAWRALAAHLPAAAATPGSTQPLGFEWRWLWNKAQGHERKVFTAHLGTVNNIAYSPDGRFVASVSSDGTAKIWDAPTEELVRTLVDPLAPRSLSAYTDQFADTEGLEVHLASFQANGRALLTGGPRLVLWDLESGNPRFLLQTNPPMWGLCSPVDSNLALAFRGFPRTDLVLVDLTTDRPIAFLNRANPDCVCFSPDGRQFALWDRTTRRISLQTLPEGNLAAWIDDGRAYIIAMAFTPDGRTLALGNMVKGSVDLFDVQTQKPVGELPGGKGRLKTLAISPDGQWLASGGFDQTIHLWNLPARTEARQLEGHRGAVYTLAFSPDSQRLASGGHDGTVRFWDVAAPSEPPPLTNVSGPFAFSTDGKLLLTQGTNGIARLWQLPEQRLIREWPMKAFQCAVFATDTVLLASTNSAREPICLRYSLPGPSQSPGQDAPAAGQALPLRGIPSPCTAICLSPDGTIAVSGHQDGTVALWEADSGRLLQKTDQPLTQPRQLIQLESLAISANSQVLAGAGFNQVCFGTWNLSNGRSLGKRHYGLQAPTALAISPDGKWIATGGPGQGLSVNVWDTALRLREMDLRGHLDVVTAAAFSPDGQTLATGGADGMLKLWHLPTQREVVTLIALERGAEARYLAFSADGSWLGAADNRGVLHLFYAPAPPVEHAALAR